jgi:hypothetical protein
VPCQLIFDNGDAIALEEDFGSVCRDLETRGFTTVDHPNGQLWVHVQHVRCIVEITNQPPNGSEDEGGGLRLLKPEAEVPIDTSA